MAKNKLDIPTSQNEGADWFATEIGRGEQQAQTGEPVNPKAAATRKDSLKQVANDKEKQKPKIKRVNKGFQVEEGRARAWDILVAKLKSDPANKKTGPELIDEAIDYLLDKYSS
jgi:hypothetical protein